MSEKRFKFSQEALVTLGIATAAVLASYIGFQQHTKDFEAAANDRFAKQDERIQRLEEHDRRDFALLSRVDARTEHLAKDIETIKNQMGLLVRQLSNKAGG